MTHATALFDASSTDQRVSLSYQVAMPVPQNHYFHVTLKVEAWEMTSLELIMPVWTPGSYLVREYARHVQEFAAMDGAGQALPWRKLSKNHWRIDCPDTPTITVHYRVFANELTVRTNHLDGTHGYFNGAALFCYLPGYEQKPLTVEIFPPYPDWQITTALPAKGEGIFWAADFDTLVDSPFEIGPNQVYDFEAEGKPHQWVIWGDGNFDITQLIQDTQKIIATEAAMFGGLPYEKYQFILHLTANNFGGLEHKNCCSLIYSRFALGVGASLAEQYREKYYRFLQLVAHEFFHLWNVKRIRPIELESFDYTQENYTPSLWFCEGITSYYDLLIPHWAGIYGIDTYLESLSRDITRYLLTPGRKVQPLSESSFDAWIKLYRRDAHSDNSQMSYYLKGQLVALLLDLNIRQRHDNQRSLNTVMVQMWEQFGREERGYSAAELVAVLESVADCDLSDFLARYLHGLEELPLQEYLQPFGLELQAIAPKTPHLGIRTKEENGKTVITFVVADSPAAQVGIDPGDELVAIAGWRVNTEQLESRLQDFQPGDEVAIAFFHDDQLRHTTVTLGEPQPNQYKLRRIKSPSPEQKQLLAGWLQG